MTAVNKSHYILTKNHKILCSFLLVAIIAANVRPMLTNPVPDVSARPIAKSKTEKTKMDDINSPKAKPNPPNSINKELLSKDRTVLAAQDSNLTISSNATETNASLASISSTGPTAATPLASNSSSVKSTVNNASSNRGSKRNETINSGLKSSSRTATAAGSSATTTIAASTVTATTADTKKSASTAAGSQEGKSKDKENAGKADGAPGSETGAKQPADFGTTSSAASSSAKPAKSSTMSTAITSSTTTAGTSSTTKRKPANRDKTQKTDATGSGQLPIESGIKELPLDQSAGGAGAKNHFGGSGSGDTDAGSSHFMVYMLVAIFLFGFLYVLYHKKQKIVGFIVEGRRSGTARRTSGGSGSGGGSDSTYKLLPTEEFGSGNSDSSKNFVY